MSKELSVTKNYLRPKSTSLIFTIHLIKSSKYNIAKSGYQCVAIKVTLD